MTTAADRVNTLNQNLTGLLAKRAELDEQIVATRNMLTGVNLGAALQKEEQDRRDSETTSE